MKSFIAATAVALALTFAAPESASAQHFHLRVHASHAKLYITPLGKQCAYNASIDPAEYPCRDGGVCVRLNATFGECQLPKKNSSASSTAGSRESNKTVTVVGSPDSEDSNDDEDGSNDDDEDSTSGDDDSDDDDDNDDNDDDDNDDDDNDDE